MRELLKAFLFGIVEGITEWLPISSTGHMILLNEFVKLDVSEAFYSMFEVVIQLGAILAVVVLFWGQIFPFERRKGRHGGASIVLNMDTVKLWIKILVACVPAAIVGLKWNDLFEELFYNYQTVSIALIVFGAAFILVENAHKGKPARINALTELTYPTVFMIGMFQLIAAVFPGTSRSGATIVGALLLGVSRTVGCGVYVLSGHSGHVRRKPAQDSQVRLCVYIHRADDPRHRYNHRVRVLTAHHPFPDGLRQEARFQGVRLVSDYPRYRRAGTLYAGEVTRKRGLRGRPLFEAVEKLRFLSSLSLETTLSSEY